MSKTVKLNWFTFRLIRECLTFEAAQIHVHAMILSHLFLMIRFRLPVGSVSRDSRFGTSEIIHVCVLLQTPQVETIY